MRDHQKLVANFSSNAWTSAGPSEICFRHKTKTYACGGVGGGDERQVVQPRRGHDVCNANKRSVMWEETAKSRMENMFVQRLFSSTSLWDQNIIDSVAASGPGGQGENPGGVLFCTILFPLTTTPWTSIPTTTNTRTDPCRMITLPFPRQHMVSFQQSRTLPSASRRTTDTCLPIRSSSPTLRNVCFFHSSETRVPI